MNQTPGQKAAKLLTYAILIAGAVFILLPFVWMILTSVKPSKEVLKMPPVWIPSKIQWQNYVKAFKAVPFFTYLKNSILVTVMITSCELITTILAAYAFAQLEFRGKNLLFLLLVATMIPARFSPFPTSSPLPGWGGSTPIRPWLPHGLPRCSPSSCCGSSLPPSPSPITRRLGWTGAATCGICSP